jgi:hypothetical protein
METGWSSKIRQSIQVHIDGRGNGAVDVGCGCQLGRPADYLDHNWGQRGAMEGHMLVRRPDEAGSGAMRVARLRYFAAVLASSLRLQWRPRFGLDA